jgi:hypothetical protein
MAFLGRLENLAGGGDDVAINRDGTGVRRDESGQQP